MATVDWKIPANVKLVKFVVEKYGVPAGEAAFGLSAGTIRGYCFRERIPLGASALAATFDVRALVDFCKSAGIKNACLVNKHGGTLPGVLGDVADADLKAAQAAYDSKFDNRGVYAPSRPSAPAPTAVQAPAPTSVPASVPTATPSLAPEASQPASAALDVDIELDTPAQRTEPSNIAQVKENVPVLNRIPPVEDIRSMDQESIPEEDVEHIELGVDMPGENPVRLARLKNKFPNAVSIFKAKPVVVGAAKVNCCRTPLWNLANSCFDKKPTKRISYDDRYVDDTRYVCGNPTDSSDSFMCRQCRAQLSEASRAGTRRFVGKGDSSPRRFY